MRPVVYILPFLMVGISFCVQAKMYKWVDEDGQMHFSDKVPVRYMSVEHQELNGQGVVINRKEAARTEEQKLEDKREAWEKKQLALVEKKKRQRDRVLLDTYTTERDLIVARDARLDAVGSQIQLAETIISDSNKIIATLEEQVARIKASDREVPDDIYGRLNKEKQQVKVQTQVMEKHKLRRDEISVQFQDYIERFKVLKTKQKVNRDRLARE